MPIFRAGNYREVLEKPPAPKVMTVAEVPSESVSSESESEEDEPVVYGQTFPESEKIKVFRQAPDDLLCGLRCLQNMYGPHICDKSEMDSVAARLQDASGIEMYDRDLGFYAAEVLETVLQTAGKHVQRIDIKKFPAENFIPIIEKNPTFTGYIATVGTGTLKHYLSVCFSSGKYKKIDSMPGRRPVKIGHAALFRKRRDGHVYCSLAHCDEPVVALLACASSPFVEYNLMHSAWSSGTSGNITSVITNVLTSMPKGAPVAVKRFLDKWKFVRTNPECDVYQYILNSICEQVEDDKTVIVHYNDQQTAIRCKTKDQLVEELVKMQWITDTEEYHLDQPGCDSLDWSRPFYLTKPGGVQVGGFYTFRSCIVGTCMEKSEDAYSVREQDGTVHVVYKKSIENVRQ